MRARAVGPPPPGPGQWAHARDPASGYPYWYNTVTGQSTWQQPQQPRQQWQQPQQLQLPPGWVVPPAAVPHQQYPRQLQLWQPQPHSHHPHQNALPPARPGAGWAGGGGDTKRGGARPAAWSSASEKSKQPPAKRQRPQYPAGHDPVNVMTERCQRDKFVPEFAFTGEATGPFHCTVSVTGCSEMEGIAVSGGEAGSKREAKKLAALAWMAAADAAGVTSGVSVGGRGAADLVGPQERQLQQDPAGGAPDVSVVGSSITDPVVLMSQRCQRDKFVPEFAFTGEATGPFHCTVSVTGCSEMEGIAVSGGEAGSKREAKKLAALAWMAAADAAGVTSGVSVGGHGDHGDADASQV